MAIAFRVLSLDSSEHMGLEGSSTSYYHGLVEAGKRETGKMAKISVAWRCEALDVSFLLIDKNKFTYCHSKSTAEGMRLSGVLCPRPPALSLQSSPTQSSLIHSCRLLVAEASDRLYFGQFRENLNGSCEAK